MKKWISVSLILVMLLSLLPADMTYATELSELTEETRETDIIAEEVTEVTTEEISEEASTTYIEPEPIIGEMETLDIVEDITNENEELLGTSNGEVAHEPTEGSSGQISNPAAYGLPTKLSEIPASWLQASGSAYNLSSVRLGYYNFVYTENTNTKGNPYHGATAQITSGQFNGLTVYLPTCRTGTSDTAPNANNHSGAGTSHNGFNAADMTKPQYSNTGDCKMNVFVTRVDTANKKVYLEFFTDYISYDASRGNTSIQSVGGSMWYPYTEFTPYTFKFRKESANPDCTNNNPLYSLAGAEYVIRDTNGASADFIVGKNGDDYIYANTASTKLITDANGYLTYTFTYDGTASNITGFYNNVAVSGNTYTITFSDGIKAAAGTYRISETQAPTGYDVDEDCRYYPYGKYHEVTINASNPVAEITCKEPPRLDPLQFSMKKGDTVYGDAACGGGSLAGAIYEVAYYDNYYNKGNLPGTPTARWYFATDSNNSWDYQFSPLFNGNGFVSSPEYRDNDGLRAIPMGTVTVKEVSAPKGYGLVNDTELQGKYVVDGSDYSDTNCILYQFKWSETDGRVLRYLDGGTTASSGNMNKIVTATYDVVMRGDLEFDKLDYKSGTKMQHIGFIIKSKTTGEQHIIVTDENGKATTKGIAHTDNTNGNDSYLDDLDNEAVKTNQLRPTGIWFYGTADQSKWNPALVDDNTGALPYDDYTVKEIVSEGNAGTQLIDYGDYTFSITANGEVNRQTLIDMDLPYFETDSADKTLGSTYTAASKNAEITDTARYRKLRFDHTYTFKGIMVAREDFTTDKGVSYKAGEPVLDDNGDYIRTNTTFDTEARNGSSYTANASGTVKLNYRFDAESLSGAKCVWKVYLCDGADNTLLVVDDNGEINRNASNVISIHMNGNERYWCEDVDLDNQREWITFPKVTLHTTALSE
ncbi:MAG: VaFE repeat-containing surface-anchored protein, partial [Lachnospiraceae bacterium]